MSIFGVIWLNNNSAVITGSSTHNERIERTWRDVFRFVAEIFYDIFHGLEGNNKLDPLNEVDVYCSHFFTKDKPSSQIIC